MDELKDTVSVCITGMHRTGTSMVTRLLNMCGLYLGSENDLMKAQPDNPEGFWENMRFVNLNDEILSKLGGAWDLPPRNIKGWEKKPALIPLKNEATTLIEEFRGHTPWGWKDPRNSLTVPFWQHIVHNLKCVICLRNPLEVAFSLQKRNHCSYALGYHLWFTYNQRLLAATTPKQRIITHYESYFINPREELKRILDFFGFSFSEEIINQACANVASSLRHHSVAKSDLEMRNIPERVLKLYNKMCRLAGPVYQRVLAGGTQFEDAKKDVMFASKVESAPKLFKDNFQNKDNMLLEQQNTIKNLLNDINNNDNYIKALEQNVYLAQEKFKTIIPSQFVISKISTYEGYKIYVEAIHDEYIKRLQFEKSLLKDSKPFTVKGYCYACKKKAEFLVDYQYAYNETEGLLIPNWRERLVCPSCGLNNRIRGAIHLFHKFLKPNKKSQIYLTEQRTPLFKWVSEKFPNVVGSEFLGDQIAHGQADAAGIRNEDMTKLSFPDNQFDFILSFDVLEHIPNYEDALRECMRVLKSKGSIMFTIPFAFTEKNIVRAVKKENGSIEHVLPSEIHGDPNSPDGSLCFYHFGWEILDQMRAIGFTDASAYFYWSKKFGYLGTNQILFIGEKGYEKKMPRKTLRVEDKSQKENQTGRDEITAQKKQAELYYQTRRFKEAFQAYKKILADFPQDVDTLQALAHLSTLLGRFDDAERFYKKINKIEPPSENEMQKGKDNSENIKKIDDSASLYIDEGNFEKAGEVLSSVFKLDPSDQDALKILQHLQEEVAEYHINNSKKHNSEKRLISVHIPKCGGTSFRNFLKTIYGKNIFSDYGLDWAIRGRTALSMTKGTLCVHGHFRADKYDRIFPSARLITWVRHPVQRIASTYFFFLKNPRFIAFDPSCRLLHENKLSLVDFAKIENVRNNMTSYFAGKTLADFSFIGIMEFYKESLERFCKMVRVPCPANIPYENVNKDRNSAQYNITSAEFNEIASLNSLDLFLYQTALDNFHAQY